MKLAGGSDLMPPHVRSPADAEPVREDATLEVVWPRRLSLDAVRALLGDDADQVLADVLASRVSAPIWGLADRGGGRWRPAISRFAFLATGGAPPAPERVCQVAELLHTGSLVIDDIQDGTTERRGGPAAHVTYGVPVALNAANAAYFRALEVLRGTLPDDLRLRALDMLVEELFTAHLGQALDLALGPRLGQGGVGTAQYVVLARAKTGALVRIAARIGAIAAGAGAGDEAALAEWASEVGVAYQIQNDLADLGGRMRDVVACRPTYPLLLVLEHGGPAAETLRARLGAAALGEADVEALRAAFECERVAGHARAAAAAAAGRALEALRVLPECAARAALERMTHELAGA